MASLFRPTRPCPLPADPVIVVRDGRPHVCLSLDGRPALLPLTRDGKKYLRPSAKWYGKLRDSAGVVRVVPLSANKDAARLLLADLVKKVEQERAGVVDRFADSRRRPLADHLEDWQASLAASGRTEDYIALKLARVRAAFAGCRFVLPADLSAERLELFLRDLRLKEGRSTQTSNDWLQAVRQFARWLVADGRLDRDPFARLRPGNVKLDQRRRRGEFTPAEVSRLLDAAGASPVVFRRLLTGRDRRMVYRVALGTGFRAAELAALVPAHFDLAAAPPVVILPAEFTKNRQPAVQPLAADLAADLRLYLAGRAAKEAVWPGTWSDRSADMLKRDLSAAGVPDRVDGPEGEEVRDFHALRNCYISNVLRAGADLKQAMTLARHSDPRLTTARYGRTRLHDLGAVVDKLPPVIPGPEAGQLRQTGTDGGRPADVPPDVPAGGSGWLRLRPDESSDADRGEPGGNDKPPGNQGVWWGLMAPEDS